MSPYMSLLAQLQCYKIKHQNTVYISFFVCVCVCFWGEGRGGDTPYAQAQGTIHMKS